MATIENFSRDFLTEKFVWHRQPPLFDKEIYTYQTEVINDSECDPLTLQPKFVRIFNDWIHDTRLNRISGLDTFQHRDFCVGTTGYMDDIYVVHGRNIRYIANEYSYHWRLNIGTLVENYADLKKGDHLIISSPFSFYGDKHPDMERILDHCDEHDVSVHVDSAWYGCVRDFEMNYDRPCIKSVGFSLSKGLSCGHNRIGVRYSKVREEGPVTITNDFNMGVVVLMSMGIALMTQFSCDFLQEKYGEVYKTLCNHLDLKPSKAIHVAFAPHPEDGAFVPVGVSQILKMLYAAN